jgi:muramoyltetrapeptide carboxypeptidase LdcA involved in peptidoglycan recycling
MLKNMFTTERTSFVRPPALQPGDQIGVVAPASNIKSDMLDAGCHELERLGFRTLIATCPEPMNGARRNYWKWFGIPM